MTLDAPQAGPMHVSLRRVAGYPAVVVVGRSDHAILKEWREKTWTNVLRTFVITALAAVLLIAFLRQLARHERVTAQLHQSQKLEALGTLAGGIAHDFNNVLGAILGYGELAIEHTAAGSSQRRYLDNIVVAANRARELVARILAFSRPGVGSATPLVLQQLLTEVRNLSAASLPARVSVEVQAPPRPLVVAGDPGAAAPDVRQPRHQRGAGSGCLGPSGDPRVAGRRGFASACARWGACGAVPMRAWTSSTPASV